MISNMKHYCSWTVNLIFLTSLIKLTTQTVNCGTQNATSCLQCPYEAGNNWCSGDCYLVHENKKGDSSTCCSDTGKSIVEGHIDKAKNLLKSSIDKNPIICNDTLNIVIMPALTSVNNQELFFGCWIVT